VKISSAPTGRRKKLIFGGGASPAAKYQFSPLSQSLLDERVEKGIIFSMMLECNLKEKDYVGCK
jgi:hypothetical protein